MFACLQIKKRIGMDGICRSLHSTNGPSGAANANKNADDNIKGENFPSKQFFTNKKLFFQAQIKSPPKSPIPPTRKARKKTFFGGRSSIILKNLSQRWFALTGCNETGEEWRVGHFLLYPFFCFQLPQRQNNTIGHRQ